MELPIPITEDRLLEAADELDALLARAHDIMTDVAQGLDARGQNFLYPHDEAHDLYEADRSITNARDTIAAAQVDLSDAIDQVRDALRHDPECTYVVEGDDGEYRCYGGDYPDAYDDYAEVSNVPVPEASNPFSVLGAQDSWGKIVIKFHGGRDACVACGDVGATRRQIVPSHLLPDAVSTLNTNHLPLCDTCTLRWVGMPAEAHYLAAAMLLQRCPDGTELLSRGGHLGMAGADLHQRDGGICRVCGLTDPDPKAFHRGHVISRHDARERKDGVVWRLPFVLSESPLNYVLMCPPCNIAIGPVSPNLRVGLRFLLKPWTSDPTAAAIIAARRAEAMKRVAEFRAERQRRLRDQ